MILSDGQRKCCYTDISVAVSIVKELKVNQSTKLTPINMMMLP